MDYESSPTGAIASSRPHRINFKKIQELKDSYNEQDVAKLKKVVQVFYKKDAGSVNELWRSFPAEYLAIVSDTYRSAIWDDNIKSITIVGGDKASYQQIFDWIMDSVKQDPAGPAPHPFYDDSTPDVFLRYARLISTATNLGIPPRDFAEPIIKKHLFKISREHFMAWDEVDFYLDTFAGDSDVDGMMREVLTNSIANAWWKREFRVNTKDADQDDYCILSVLRAEHSQLDEDLHQWCQKNEARIKDKWAEKEAARNAPANGGGEDFSNDFGNDFGNNEVTTYDDAVDNTDKENMTPPDSGYNSVGGGAAPSLDALGSAADWEDNGGAGGDWGDEMNAFEQQQHTTIW
ncbi:hypothetical protein DV738_g2914, partial [Chaetothyriales sp. CBS 135597]